jgi:hypothetical protein
MTIAAPRQRGLSLSIGFVNRFPLLNRFHHLDRPKDHRPDGERMIGENGEICPFPHLDTAYGL